MPINQIHRSQLLDQLQSLSTEKQQSLEGARQDSMSEFESAQQSISQTRQNARANEIQLYNQNVESQSNTRRELNNGYDILASSRNRIRYLRNKERLQSRKMTKFTLMKKRYKEIKDEDIKQKELESQTRQGEALEKAKEMVNNIFPSMQKSILEAMNTAKNTI